MIETGVLRISCGVICRLIFVLLLMVTRLARRHFMELSPLIRQKLSPMYYELCRRISLALYTPSLPLPSKLALTGDKSEVSGDPPSGSTKKDSDVTSLITINVGTSGSSADEDLRNEIKKLKHRMSRLEQQMSEFDDVLVDLDDATNVVADRVQGLIDEVAGLQGREAASVKANAESLRPFVSHLREIGADKDQPVPPLPDVPPADGSGTSEPGPVDSGVPPQEETVPGTPDAPPSALR